jgi:hypothetical protein
MRTIGVFALACCAGLAGGAALAQGTGNGFVACSSQTALEQYLDSNGDLMPDECRAVSFTVLESGGRQLCVADISSGGNSLLGGLADAAVPTEWWTSCQDAAALLR